MALKTYRIGTRGSPLALAQAHEVRSRLMDATGFSEARFEIVTIVTTGDRITDRPLAAIGGKGLFTKEIEEGLLSGDLDLAVHSMKDMPTELPEGLSIDCVLPREDVRDALISAKFGGLDDLPEGAVIGTSSLRRRAQLALIRPDLKFVDFRGNVQTRLRKLDEGQADATLLAVAGLNRLGMSGVITQALPTDRILPAPAQGAVCIERSTKRDDIHEMLSLIHDTDTQTRISAERSFLAEMEGSCEVPIAALADIDGDMVELNAQIFSDDTQRAFRSKDRLKLTKTHILGKNVAKSLKKLRN